MPWDNLFTIIQGVVEVLKIKINIIIIIIGLTFYIFTGHTVLGIIDVLDIDWASLMKQNVPKLVSSGSALKRFTPASIFKKIGVSLQFAGEKLYTKIETVCEKQLDESEMSRQGDDGEHLL